MELHHSFGDLLRVLRRRASLTQTELGDAVGCATQHINALELNMRVPDIEPLVALFIPALGLQTEHETAARLLSLAEIARAEQRVLITIERSHPPAAPADCPQAVWEALPPAPARLARMLAMLDHPVDLRSAIVSDAFEGAVDVRQSGRLLLADHVIGAASEAELSPRRRDLAREAMSDPEWREACLAAAHVSEYLYNDFAGALRLRAQMGDSSAGDVLLDRCALIHARGETAAMLAALDEALRALRRGAFASNALWRLHAARGELQILNGDPVEAERSLREAMGLARVPERRARLGIALASLMLRRGGAAEAIELTGVILDSLTALDTLQLCQTSAIQAQAREQLGQMDAARETAERALWLADAVSLIQPGLGDDARAAADNVLGAAHRIHGQTQLALYHYNRADRAAERAHTQHQSLLALSNSASLLFDQGMPEYAAPPARRALASALALGHNALAGRMSHLLGAIHLFAGESAGAAANTGQAIALRQQAGDSAGVVASRAQQIRVTLDGGAAQQALAAAQALEAETRHAEPLWHAAALDMLALAAMACDEIPAAHTAFEELRHILQSLKHPGVASAVRNHMALFALVRSLPIEALRTVSQPSPLTVNRDLEWERLTLEALATRMLGHRTMAACLFDRIQRVAPLVGYARYGWIATRASAQLAGDFEGNAARLYFADEGVRASRLA